MVVASGTRRCGRVPNLTEAERRVRRGHSDASPATGLKGIDTLGICAGAPLSASAKRPDARTGVSAKHSTPRWGPAIASLTAPRRLTLTHNNIIVSA